MFYQCILSKRCFPSTLSVHTQYKSKQITPQPAKFKLKLNKQNLNYGMHFFLSLKLYQRRSKFSGEGCPPDPLLYHMVRTLWARELYLPSLPPPPNYILPFCPHPRPKSWKKPCGRLNNKCASLYSLMIIKFLQLTIIIYLKWWRFAFLTTLIDNNLSDVSTGCSSPPLVETSDKLLSIKVVKNENLHYFMSTGTTEKSLHYYLPWNCISSDEVLNNQT